MKTRKIGKICITTILLLFALLWIAPLFFSFLNLFKSRIEYNLGSFGSFPITNNFLENWQGIVGGLPLFLGMRNSFFYAFLGAFYSVMLGTLAAYGLSHLKIAHKKFWFLIIYSGTIFPFQLYLIPIYRAYISIGLFDTMLGMILFYTAICIPFVMFVMRNNFLGINKEISESAKIEGATDFQVLIKLFVPMSQASLAVVFLTQFAWGWNDLMFGLTLTKSNPVRTVMSVLSVMDKNNPPLLLLACLIASIPTILMFSILQKHCERGFVYTSK